MTVSIYLNIGNFHPLAKKKNGNIAGIKKSSTYIFRGIKYANAERFHMPSKVGPWEN